MADLRQRFGQILAVYGAILLCGAGVYYGAADGEVLGVLLVFSSFASVPFALLGKPDKAQLAVGNLTVSPPSREGKPKEAPVSLKTAGKEAPSPSTAKSTLKVPPASPSTRRQKPDNAVDSLPDNAPRYLRLWQRSQELRQKETLAGSAPPPPATPLIIRDLCASSPDEALIVPNARTPIAFANEYFKGRALVKLKTYPDDPYYASYFEGKKRLFEVQVQGQFRESTQGQDMYIGMEVPDPVSLGVVTKALSRVILGVINRLVKGAHYSFGDGKEIPHICFPLQASVDRLVITEPGQTPPPLGVEMFPETLTKPQRMALKHTFVPENTYSMSLHGMYVDYVRWQVANLPGLRPIDLRLFWGNMPLRLIAYTVPSNYKGPHTEEIRKMLFRFELDNINDKLTEVEEPKQPQRRKTSVHEGEAVTFDDIGDEDDIPQDVSYTALSMVSETPSRGTELEVGDDAGLSDVSPAQTPRAPDSLSLSQVSTSSVIASTPKHALVAGKIPNLEQLAGLVEKTPPTDVMVTQYIVGLHAHGGLWYAVRVTEQNGKSWAILRPAKAFHSLPMPNGAAWSTEKSVTSTLGLTPPPKTLLASAAAHIHERQLGQMTTFLRQYLNSGQDGIYLLRWFLQHFDQKITLLAGKKASFRASSRQEPIHEGSMVLSNWETRWVECWGVLTNESLQLFTGTQKKPNYVIPVASVLSVSQANEKPYPGAFFQVRTLGRVHYLCVASDRRRQAWLAALTEAMATKSDKLAPDPRAEFMFKCGKWGSERIVMNARVHALPKSGTSPPDPQVLIQELLRQALSLTVDSPESQLIAFLDMTAQLKLVDTKALTAMSHDEALAFWLNFYHCLLAHALLILGPPTTSRSALTFFNSVSYDLAGLPFSLGEVEHSILRAPMSQPDVLLKFVLPGRFSKSDPRHRFVLREREPRINFALNWGGVCCGAQVPVYLPDRINKQLNQIEPAKQLITVPKLCDWYVKDFGSSRMDTLKWIMTHLPAEQYESMSDMLSDSLSVKYGKHEWSFVDKLSEMPPDNE